MNTSVSVLRKPRFGPPKKTLSAKGLALSENFGLRRLVREDCVRHQAVRTSGGGFRGSEIVRHYKALAGPSTVCGGNLAGLSGFCVGMRLGVSGRKIPFPKCALVGPREATSVGDPEGGANLGMRLAGRG